MHAVIISIGDELLKGHSVNTNAPWIARELASVGIAVRRIVTCSDEPDEISAAVEDGLEREELVLTTGGLGPTRDDRTRNAVRKLLGRGLELDSGTCRRLAEWYRKRGRNPAEAIREQAMIIEGAVAVPNTKGMAPGMVIDCGDRFGNHRLVLMPGVPEEMEAMMKLTVIPLLARLSGISIVHTPVKTIGIGETQLAAMIRFIEDGLPAGTTISYLPHISGVNLMITSAGSDRQTVEQQNRGVVDAVVGKAGSFVYATSDVELEEVVGQLLLEKKLRVAVAESCTGGLIASRLTDIAGSSRYFLCGMVTYSNEAKEELLGVDPEAILLHGAVSEEVAAAMAQGCLKRSNADIAVATTGIAGPSGGSAEKPVGMLCLALAVRSDSGAVLVSSRTLHLNGDRRQNKRRFSDAALRELLKALRID